MRFLCKKMQKYLAVWGKVRNFAPVQWNEGLHRESLILFY